MAGGKKVKGTMGNDVIVGTEKDETILGLAGDDVLSGGDGDDVIVPGDGNNVLDGGANTSLGDVFERQIDGSGDILDYSHLTTSVQVSLATDSARHGESTDSFAGFEYIVGSDFDDTLDGSEGPDILEGALGRDVIRGLGGNDVLIGDYRGAREDAADILEGGDGDDVLIGTRGNDIMDGGDGVDSIYYGEERIGIVADLESGTVVVGKKGEVDTVRNVETVVASAKVDSLRGDEGDNVLRALQGNDRLDGRGGDDYLQGGTGEDKFVFDYSSDGPSLGHDTIDDFTNFDRLAIAFADGDSNLKGRALFELLDDNFDNVLDGDEGLVTLDIGTNREGDRAASLVIELLPDQTITLFGVTELTVAAFIAP